MSLLRFEVENGTDGIEGTVSTISDIPPEFQLKIVLGDVRKFMKSIIQNDNVDILKFLFKIGFKPDLSKLEVHKFLFDAVMKDSLKVADILVKNSFFIFQTLEENAYGGDFTVKDLAVDGYLKLLVYTIGNNGLLKNKYYDNVTETINEIHDHILFFSEIDEDNYYIKDKDEDDEKIDEKYVEIFGRLYEEYKPLFEKFIDKNREDKKEFETGYHIFGTSEIYSFAYIYNKNQESFDDFAADYRRNLQGYVGYLREIKSPYFIFDTSYQMILQTYHFPPHLEEYKLDEYFTQKEYKCGNEMDVITMEDIDPNSYFDFGGVLILPEEVRGNRSKQGNCYNKKDLFKAMLATKIYGPYPNYTDRKHDLKHTYFKLPLDGVYIDAAGLVNLVSGKILRLVFVKREILGTDFGVSRTHDSEENIYTLEHVIEGYDMNIDRDHIYICLESILLGYDKTIELEYYDGTLNIDNRRNLEVRMRAVVEGRTSLEDFVNYDPDTQSTPVRVRSPRARAPRAMSPVRVVSRDSDEDIVPDEEDEGDFLAGGDRGAATRDNTAMIQLPEILDEEKVQDRNYYRNLPDEDPRKNVLEYFLSNTFPTREILRYFDDNGVSLNGGFSDIPISTRVNQLLNCVAVDLVEVGEERGLPLRYMFTPDRLVGTNEHKINYALHRLARYTAFHVAGELNNVDDPLFEPLDDIMQLPARIGIFIASIFLLGFDEIVSFAKYIVDNQNDLRREGDDEFALLELIVVYLFIYNIFDDEVYGINEEQLTAKRALYGLNIEAMKPYIDSLPGNINETVSEMESFEIVGDDQDEEDEDQDDQDDGDDQIGNLPIVGSGVIYIDENVRRDSFVDTLEDIHTNDKAFYRSIINREDRRFFKDLLGYRVSVDMLETYIDDTEGDRMLSDVTKDQRIIIMVNQIRGLINRNIDGMRRYPGSENLKLAFEMDELRGSSLQCLIYALYYLRRVIAINAFYSRYKDMVITAPQDLVQSDKLFYLLTMFISGNEPQINLARNVYDYLISNYSMNTANEEKLISSIFVNLLMSIDLRERNVEYIENVNNERRLSLLHASEIEDLPNNISGNIVTLMRSQRSR